MTFYGLHARRGKEAMDELGLLGNFTGYAVHDHWKSYFKFPCEHALCNAHHLRELTYLAEQDGCDWTEKLMQLLLEVKDLVSATSAKCLAKDSSELASMNLRYEAKNLRLFPQRRRWQDLRPPPGRRLHAEQERHGNPHQPPIHLHPVPVLPKTFSSLSSYSETSRQTCRRLVTEEGRATTSFKTTKPTQIDSKEWGKSVTLFNTRIPQESSDMLDDLDYNSKKEGNPITKQAIAIEALENYLRQEGILRSVN